MADAYYEYGSRQVGGGKETRQGGGMERVMMSAVGQQLTECSIDVVGMVSIP
jgi:hypothetical protein